MITSIKRDGEELIPYDNPACTFGYDDLLLFFPVPLVELHDEKIPLTKGWEILW